MAAAAAKQAGGSEIADLVATLAGRQTSKGPGKTLNGPERAAVLMLALGEQHGEKIWKLLDDDELRQLSVVMSTLGTVEAEVGRSADDRVRRPALGLGRAARQFRRDRAAAGPIPPGRPRLQHHGGNPRAGRPQHVGEALQRAGAGARELPEERISADRRGRAVEDPPRACGARARDPARGARARRRDAHAQDGGGAEGSDRAAGKHAAHRIHVEPVADPPARRARDHGGDLQLVRPPDRDALHHRAGGGRTANPPSASRR